MNAANLETGLNQDHSDDGSDSDAISEDSPEYYQPISSSDSEDGAEQISDQRISNPVNHNNDDNYRIIGFGDVPSGYANCEENGVLIPDLTNTEEESGDEDEVAEERVREAADVAIQRAFREDESRRNAPLTPENANRVMEAMRGVSFTGLAPAWAARVPEDRWIEQLRGLRQSPSASSSLQN